MQTEVGQLWGTRQRILLTDILRKLGADHLGLACGCGADIVHGHVIPAAAGRMPDELDAVGEGLITKHGRDDLVHL